MSVKAGGYEKSIKILSKVSHAQDIEFPSMVNKLIFSRPQKSSGQVLITGIMLKIFEETDKPKAANKGAIKLEEDLPPPDWKGILHQCKPHKKVRVVNDRLFVSEGASIKASKIESVITVPPNAYNVKDGFIKFITPCEILELRLFDKSLVVSKPLYTHMATTTPPTIRTGDSHEPSSAQTFGEFAPLYPRISTAENKSVNTVIYDSKVHGLDVKTLGKVSGSISNVNGKKGLMLGREASFVIPMSQMECYVEYVIAISGRKINGNGKLDVSIITSRGERRDGKILCAANLDKELFYKIKSGAPPGTKNYQIKIERPKATTGDVLINRIKIIHGLSFRPPYIPAHTQRTNTLKGLVGLRDVANGDVVAQNAKKYSRYLTYETKEKHRFKGDIYITTLSGINWFNKIKPLCPNLNLDVTIGDHKKDIVMGELGALLPAKKIWVDAFSDYGKMSDPDDAAFSQADMIITPSFSNSQFLMDKYKDAEVVQAERSWPFIETTPTKYFNQDYFLYFNRNIEITKRFLKVYRGLKDLPKLVVIGARGSYPSCVIPVNEYTAYNKFLYILLNSKMIIDFTPNTDYNSAAISMALDEGIPVVSSNWFCLDKENAKFVVSKDSINDINIPTSEAMEDSLLSANESLTKIVRKTEANNSKLYHLLSLLSSK